MWSNETINKNELWASPYLNSISVCIPETPVLLDVNRWWRRKRGKTERVVRREQREAISFSLSISEKDKKNPHSPISCVSESGYFYIQLELKDTGTHSTGVNAPKCFKMCPRRSGSGERCSSRRLALRVKLEINLKNINKSRVLLLFTSDFTGQWHKNITSWTNLNLAMAIFVCVVFLNFMLKEALLWPLMCHPPLLGLKHHNICGLIRPITLCIYNMCWTYSRCVLALFKTCTSACSCGSYGWVAAVAPSGQRKASKSSSTHSYHSEKWNANYKTALLLKNLQNKEDVTETTSTNLQGGQNCKGGHNNEGNWGVKYTHEVTGERGNSWEQNRIQLVR